MTVELVICPLCRAEIHRHVAGRVETKMRLPSRTTQGGNAMQMLAEMARREHEDELALCEQACVNHYQARHRIRFSLWHRFHRTWLLNWPGRKPRAPLPGQAIFDPLEFIKC